MKNYYVLACIAFILKLEITLVLLHSYNSEVSLHLKYLDRKAYKRACYCKPLHNKVTKTVTSTENLIMAQ